MHEAISQRVSLAGISVDLLTIKDLLSLLVHATATQDKCLILHHNLHSLCLYHTVSDFKVCYSQASHVYIDGIPVVWLGKIAGLPARSEHRITLLDSFTIVLRKAEQCGWRVFYLGSLAEVITRGLDAIKQEYPQLNISGHHGYFENHGFESDEVISKINSFGADILFVGLGMPLQERWLAEHHSQINASAILTCGATLDYLTGHAYRPPAWVGPLGLYGIFRLVSDPRRLWKRYLVEPVILLKHMFFPLMRQCLRHLMISELR
jgi:N-acetylglucosaminyldiphosphoundecaprenol N-acetyl-beta-D-mannosaminyltransferase